MAQRRTLATQNLVLIKHGTLPLTSSSAEALLRSLGHDVGAFLRGPLDGSLVKSSELKQWSDEKKYHRTKMVVRSVVRGLNSLGDADLSSERGPRLVRALAHLRADVGNGFAAELDKALTARGLAPGESSSS